MRRGVDRRKMVRYTVKRCTVLFRRNRLWLFYERPPGHHGPVVDLNSQGVSFLTRHRMKPGDRLRITFDIPFEVYAIPPGFCVHAQVKWVGPASGGDSLRRVGCMFHRLKPDDQEMLVRIIRWGILRER
jgi:hypothetical protein